MLENYLKIAARNLRKHRAYVLINIGGFAVGMACCLIIALYVRHELSFDRFHDHADRIVRVTTRAGIGDEVTHFAGAAPPIAAVSRQHFPEVENAVRVRRGESVVRVDANVFSEQRFYFADSTFFDMFSLSLLEGDPATALTAPNSVVLTKTAAERYFGDANPVGATILADDNEFRVTGVMEDVPQQSHFRFDVLASIYTLRLRDEGGPDTWVSNIGNYTYLLLRPGTSADALERKMAELTERTVGELLGRLGAHYALVLQPLTDIHLQSSLTDEIEPNSRIAYVYIFSSAALLILLIACLNFMNLATARSADRAREVGMRKVLGARRPQLIRQFLVESVLLTTLAMVLALALARASLPLFNEIAGRPLALNDSRLLVGAAFGVSILVGLLAGSYPALYLSGFRPIHVLKGRFRSSAAGAAIRKGLVVAQFGISTLLIIGTGVISSQLDYARTQRLGFEPEQVVVLPIYEDAQLSSSSHALKQEIAAHPSVLSAAGANHFPGGPVNDRVFIPEGASDSEGIHFWSFDVDSDFLETLGMEVALGRGFSQEFLSDSSAVLINETAAALMGWREGRGLYDLGGADLDDRDLLTVVGVVKDFHFESFRNEIRPLVLMPVDTPAYLLVRLKPEGIRETLGFIEEQWTRLGSGIPFRYTFLDERFAALYRSEEQLSRVFQVFTVLALMIACLGLFALSAFSTEQRTKEIGVRKVLGATVPGIVVLLSKDFLKLVLIGFIVAAPVAYVLMERWLESFAYRVSVGPSLFIASAAVAVLIAILTVSFQSIRAALSNPVESLRYE